MNTLKCGICSTTKPFEKFQVFQSDPKNWTCCDCALKKTKVAPSKIQLTSYNLIDVEAVLKFMQL